MIADGAREAARNAGITPVFRLGQVTAVTTPFASITVDGDAAPISARMVGRLTAGDRTLVVYTANGGVWAFPGPGTGPGLIVPAVSVTGDQAGIGAGPVDLTGLTVFWTARPTVTYRVWGLVDIFSTVNGDGFTLRITDAAGIEKGHNQLPNGLSNAAVRTSEVVAIETGLSGSQTRKLRLERIGTGTLTARGGTTAPKLMTVEALT